MCGIIGYIGKQQAAPILLEGLRRLEYRGYDSAGLALAEPAGLRIVKVAGRVAELAERVEKEARDSVASAGIGHTRWATHGVPSENNAHPHTDGPREFACVHNGIIENYAALRERLERKGYRFHSDTDTEVIPHLIREFYRCDFFQALASALRQLEGTWGLAAISVLHPGRILAARRGSPIIIGLGDGESIIASDAAAIVRHTDKVVYLDDGDIAEVSASGLEVRNLDNVPVDRAVVSVGWDRGAAEKGGYEHFMLKEIFEQPEALRNTIRGRLDSRSGTAILSGLGMAQAEAVGVSRVIIAACGTSRHAGMVGEYFFEDLADLPCEVEQAAEFRYRNPIIDDKTLVLAVSQSGETADTLAALREAMMKGARVAGICNVVGSTIAREAGRGIYLHAGPEIGVASTKAFTCQVAALLMMALKFGRARRLTREAGLELVREIESAPDLAGRVLERAPEIKALAEKWAGCGSFFFIGRGYLYPVALEGALKLKEISYIHAEGYHAAELKHGPIALLEPRVPVVALANDLPGKPKMRSNIHECLARGAPVIATATEGDNDVAGLTPDIIRLPASSPFLAPIATAMALQLFAYYMAVCRGCDVDRPRNLAKSVTVE